MPRRHRRAVAGAVDRPAGAPSPLRRDLWRGEEYDVRAVGGASGRTYRCPGCDQEIGAQGHLVVWPSFDVEAADRRHWHTVCWAARDRRAPTIQRGRGTPRF